MFTLIQFDKDSKHYAGQIAIQETDRNGKLLNVSDFDGDTITAPGGPNATWSALLTLESEDFWMAVGEVSEASLIVRMGGKVQAAEYEATVLGIGREFLPFASVGMLDGSNMSEETSRQHWAFVYAQYELSQVGAVCQ